MLWDKGWVNNARQALNDCPPSLRNWEWSYYQRKLYPAKATFIAGPIILLNPDETRLLSGGKSLKVWATTDGQEIASSGDLSRIAIMAMHPDGQVVAAANDQDQVTGASSSVLVWDWVNQRRVAMLELQSDVLSLGYSPDGTRLVAGLRDGAVKFWNAADYQEITADFKHPGGVSQLQFLPRNGIPVTGCMQGILNVWNPATGQVKESLDVHGIHNLMENGVRADQIRSLLPMNHGQELQCVTIDGTVKWYETETLSELASYKVDCQKVDLVAMSPDHQTQVIQAESEISVKIRDATTGSVKLVLPTSGGKTTAITFSPDNCRLAIGFSDGRITIWDFTAGKLSGTHAGRHTNLIYLGWFANLLGGYERAGAVLGSSRGTGRRGIQ